jgi:hypothetical protein
VWPGLGRTDDYNRRDSPVINPAGRSRTNGEGNAEHRREKDDGRHSSGTADNREREKWHRDNLLRICSEAVRVSREISHQYNEAAGVSLKLSNPEDFDDAFWEHMDAAQTAIAKVARRQTT